MSQLPMLARQGSRGQWEWNEAVKLLNAARFRSPHSDVETVLTMFQNISYPSSLVTPNAAGDALTQCVVIVDATNGAQASRLMRWIVVLMCKQEVVLDRAQLSQILPVFQAVIASPPPHPVPAASTRAEALQALSHVVYERAPLMSDAQHDSLLALLLPLLHDNDTTVVKGACNVLGNVTCKSGQSVAAQERHTKSFRALYRILESSRGSNVLLMQSHQVVVVSACLRALHYVMLESRTCHSAHVSGLVEAVYGLLLCPPTTDTSPSTSPLSASPMSSPRPSPPSSPRTPHTTLTTSSSSSASASASATTSGSASASGNTTFSGSVPSAGSPSSKLHPDARVWGRSERHWKQGDDKDDEAADDAAVLEEQSRQQHQHHQQHHQYQQQHGGGGQSVSVSSSTSAEQQPQQQSQQSQQQQQMDSVANLKKKMSYMRCNALLCIQAITRTTPKLLQGHWTKLLPSTPPNTSASKPMLSHVTQAVHALQIPDPHAPPAHSIVTCLLEDLFPKVRVTAAVTLYHMLESSRQFVQMAEQSHKTRSSPFLSLSQTIGAIIVELHRALVYSLGVERHVIVVVQAIKCLTALVQVTPYDRMQLGFLSRVIPSLQVLVGVSDIQISVPALACLAAVFSTAHPLTEVTHFILPPASTATTSGSSGNNTTIVSSSLSSSGPHSSGAAGVPALPSAHSGRSLSTPVSPHPTVVDHLMALTASKTLSAVVECLLCLSRICRNYVFCLERHWKALLQLAIHHTAHPEEPARIHATKLLEEMAQAILECKIADPPATSEPPKPQPPRTGAATPASRGAANVPRAEFQKPLKVIASNTTLSRDSASHMSRELWTTIFNELLPKLFTDKSTTVRSTACFIVGCVDATSLKTIPDAYKTSLAATFRMVVEDSVPSVRAAALRTLGIFVQTKYIQMFPDSIRNIAELLVRVGSLDENVNVRSRSYWTLANLCDYIAQAIKNSANLEACGITQDILEAITANALTAMQDSDKVQPNAVRALGHAAGFRFKTTAQNLTVIRAILESLKAKALKVRWNACYALGQLFCQPVLIEGISDANKETAWTHEVLGALTHVLVTEKKNFKIRIHAAAALSQPSSYMLMAHSYIPVLDKVLAVLEQPAEEVTDPAEFKYKQTLATQLKCTVFKLIMLGLNDQSSSATTEANTTTTNTFVRLLALLAQHPLSVVGCFQFQYEQAQIESSKGRRAAAASGTSTPSSSAATTTAMAVSGTAATTGTAGSTVAGLSATTSKDADNDEDQLVSTTTLTPDQVASVTCAFVEALEQKLPTAPANLLGPLGQILTQLRVLVKRMFEFADHPAN